MNKAVLIIITTIVALIVGIAGTYAYVSNRNNKDIEKLNNQIAELQAKNQSLTESPVATTSPDTSPTPDETADWKTYTNDEYGFSLEYPSDWYLPSYYSNNRDIYNNRIDITTDKNFQQSVSSGSAFITFWASSDKVLDEEIADAKRLNPTLSSSEATLGNIAGIELKGENAMAGGKSAYETKICATKGSVLYCGLLRYWTGDQKTNEYIEIFNRIVSNFKVS